MPPTDAKGHFEAGLKAFREGQYQTALDAFNSAITIGGKRVIFLDSRAAVYEKLGDVKKGLEDAKACVTIDPKSAKGYLRSSRLFASIGRYSSAVTMLEHGISLSPTEKHASLHTLLNELKQKEEEKGRKLDPVVVLPAELWGEVLKHGVRGNPDFAIRPALVCRAWREATLNSIPAWSRLSSRKAATQNAKIRAWVQRSAGRIEEIVLRTANEPAARRAGLELSDCIGGVRMLDIAGTYRGIFSSLCDAWKGQLEQIETLKLGSQDAGQPIPAMPLRLDFELLSPTCTSLRSLTLGSFHLPTIRHPVLGFAPSQLENLKYLDLSTVQCLPHNTDLWTETYDVKAIDRLHAILCRSPALETLLLPPLFSDSIHWAVPRREPFDIAAKILLPKLTTLRDESSIPLPIRTPALRHLALPRDPSYFSQRVAYHEADPASLTSFTFGNTVDASPRFMEFLTSLTSLTSVRFERGITDQTIEFLSKEPLIVTHLSTIYIGRSEITSGPLLRFVKARLPSSPASAPKEIPRPAKRIFGATTSTPSLEVSLPPAAPVVKDRDNGAVAAAIDTPDEEPAAEVEMKQTQRIVSMVLDRCPKVEKVAEEWLSKNVADFRCIHAPPPTAGYRDRFQ